MVDCLLAMLDDILKVFSPVRGTPRASLQSLVYQISLNRQASMALTRSVPAVKADAAHKLFTVDCSEIVWAVVDSGIQGDHPAFKARDGKSSRVRRAFDFSNFRKIVSLNNLRIFSGEADEEVKNASLKALLHKRLKNKPSKKDAIRYLTSLANDAKSRRPVHWEFVEPFVEIKPETHPTVSDHGTHVAGIIGASKTNPLRDQADEDADGMCPNIGLYDFRVLAESSDIKDTEFAIIAALQYIRHVNERHDFITIHGANLSLSIPHDVRNYACGRTPVCDECERLINSGVVVVAAAGNFGYQSFQTKDGGSYEGYTAFSITDPGNADGVITVGATHRFWPHTYGVSFFSSRGPTGDGRLKPDLVAPGERIRAPFREGWDDLDGTSMAAPHVSGAAAMLMARYSELIGQPRRIKRILCDNATDLGRERSFQGHGMLDVLRAFQSL
jgi:subtilisin family serine protease